VPPLPNVPPVPLEAIIPALPNIPPEPAPVAPPEPIAALPPVPSGPHAHGSKAAPLAAHVIVEACMLEHVHEIPLPAIHVEDVLSSSLAAHAAHTCTSNTNGAARLRRPGFISTSGHLNAAGRRHGS